MKDNSFKDLTKEENLKRIKIDDVLEPIFIKVMENMGEYFNYMGYTKTRNYKKFFENYLISKYGISNINILCNNKPSSENCVGFYNYSKKEIVIAKSTLYNKTEAIATLTHEFIHFLVLHELRENKLSEPNSFIDESLTEILKMKILPLTEMSYASQIAMYKFYMLLNDKKIDFNNFLNGKFDNIDYNLETKFADYLQSIDVCEHLEDAKDNKLYIELQRYLIKQLNVDIKSLADYEKLINKLAKRPVEDKNFMNKYYKTIESFLWDKLNILDKNIKNKYLIYLKELREVIEALNNNNLKYVYNFNYDGDKYQIDERRNVYIDGIFNKKVKVLKIDEYTEEFVVNIFNSDLYKKNLKLVNNRKLRFKEKIIKNENIKVKEELFERKNKLETILGYLKFINDSEIITDFKDKSLSIQPKNNML